jgi:hypothetical protein
VVVQAVDPLVGVMRELIREAVDFLVKVIAVVMGVVLTTMALVAVVLEMLEETITLALLVGLQQMVQMAGMELQAQLAAQ